jgi:hypothetical protein
VDVQRRDTVLRYAVTLQVCTQPYRLHMTCYKLQGTLLQITKDTRFSLHSPDFIRWWQYYIEVNTVTRQQKFFPRLGALPLQLEHL